MSFLLIARKILITSFKIGVIHDLKPKAIYSYTYL